MKRLKILMIAAALLFSASGAFARQQGDATQAPDSSAPIAPLPPQDEGNGSRQAPEPAGRALSLYGSQDQDSGQATPDDTTLSGGEIIGLGSLTGTQTLFAIAYQFGEFAETGVSQGDVDSVTSIGGSFALDQHWERYHLSAAYSGAQTFYSPDSSVSAAYHNAAIAQEIKWRRLVLHLRDNLNVSPQSTFGGLYTGSAGLAGQSTVINGYSPVITSGETILTGTANRADNVAFAGIDLLVSRRTTLTLTGSYEFLDFFTPGYIDYHDVTVGAGYNYALSPKNTVAIVYNFSRTAYSGASGGATESHVAQLAYGRKINGRMAFQLSAGPQLVVPENSGPSNGRYWTWSLSSSLSYRLSRVTGASFGYYHIASNGSGVFTGSESDTFSGGINHQFTRFWSASVNGGYSRNGSIVSSNTAANQFDDWFAGVSVGRQIGREISANANAGYQRQIGGTGACPVLTCGYAGSSNFVAGLTVGWSPLAIGKK